MKLESICPTSIRGCTAGRLINTSSSEGLQRGTGRAVFVLWQWDVVSEWGTEVLLRVEEDVRMEPVPRGQGSHCTTLTPIHPQSVACTSFTWSWRSAQDLRKCVSKCLGDYGREETNPTHIP